MVHFTGLVTNIAFRPAFVNGASTSQTSPWFAATANTGYVLLLLLARVGVFGVIPSKNPETSSCVWIVAKVAMRWDSYSSALLLFNHGIMQYTFQGHNLTRRPPRILWPAAIVTLTLSSNKDRYMSDVVNLELTGEYIHAPNNVSCFHLLSVGRYS
jgi:hypothetical protein